MIPRRNESRGLTRGAGQAIVLMILVVANGCKASVKAEAKTSLDVEETPADFDEPSAATPGNGPTRAGRLDTEPPALLGARHDLRVVPGKQSTLCRCLAVALGAPNDSAFLWEADIPTIDPTTELVIAFSSADTGCTEEPKESLGASYWGYQTSGEDVVVVVESARSGRPVTTGAIIPRPGPGGHVYLRPVDSSVPYAKTEKDAPNGCVVKIPDS
ncbi:MAG: hypothetical protein JW940_10685 [Polyangiaceae bacterium]|nr:hypothetical protein [Polyangiaceae bacterium]